MLRGARTAFAFALALASAAAPSGCVDEPGKHRLQANAYLRGGDAESALRQCDLGLAARKDDLALLILRGKALFELDRFDEARASYERALHVGANEEPRSLADAQIGLAMIASRHGEWAEARRRFEALVAVNGKDASSRLNVARACLKLEDLACAVEHGEAAGRLRGDDEAVLYTLGTIYLQADRARDAELTFQHICEVVPAAASCPYGIALVAAKSGDKARALAHLREAVARKVPNPEQIAKEPAFASIKDDPELAAIVVQATAPR